jgi:hypothetical protein
MKICSMDPQKGTLTLINDAGVTREYVRTEEYAQEGTDIDCVRGYWPVVLQPLRDSQDIPDEIRVRELDPRPVPKRPGGAVLAMKPLVFWYRAKQ